MNPRLAWALALIGVITAVVVALYSTRDAAPAREAGRSSSKISSRVDLEQGRGSPHAASEAGVAMTVGGLEIRGRITDAELGPLSEGRLDVYCLESLFQSTATIGAEGEFEISGCATGPSCLRLTHPSVEQPRAWELEAGRELELETTPAATVAGTIRSAAGEIVAGADLLVEVAGVQLTGRSDAEGEYAVALLRARPCDRCDPPSDGDRGCRDLDDDVVEPASMLVAAVGFAPLALEFPAQGDVSLDLVLQPPGPALTGRVLGRDGEPFDERTRVLATNVAREQERHAASVDAHGSFAFEALAADGEYGLRAIRDEREIATLASARPGDRVELRAAASARGSTLTLELIDADADPVAGARVDGGPFRAAITDAAGRVEAEDVLPGGYTVRVRRPDCAMIRETIELEELSSVGASTWLRRVQLPENC